MWALLCASKARPVAQDATAVRSVEHVRTKSDGDDRIGPLMENRRRNAWTAARAPPRCQSSIITKPPGDRRW